MKQKLIDAKEFAKRNAVTIVCGTVLTAMIVAAAWPKSEARKLQDAEFLAALEAFLAEYSASHP